MSEPKARAEELLISLAADYRKEDDAYTLEDKLSDYESDRAKVLAFAQAERRLALEEAAKVAEQAIGAKRHEIAAAIRQQGGG